MNKLRLFIPLLLLVLLVSCSKNEPTPEERFSEYIKLWNEQKFEQMYDYLSTETKTNISKENFVSRYEKIYHDLEINRLDVQLINTKDNEVDYRKEENVELSYSSKMDSIAGEIGFDHTATFVKEEREKENNWYLNWNTGFIFPELGSGDKVSFQTTQAKRGDIMDRHNKPLATNGVVYQIGVVPSLLGDKSESVINKLSKLLDMSKEQIDTALNADWVQPEYFVPLKKVSPDNQALLKKLFVLDGVQKQDAGARVYPYGEAAAHVIGYVGPITAEELEEQEGKGYTSTDVIGKRGLEQVFEEKLKGENGVKITIKKADNTEVVLAEKEVKNGETVRLTIDGNLQLEVYEQLSGEAGMAAAMNPTSGETLALVSSPAFDPNHIVLGLSAKQQESLNNNNKQPFLNRFKLTYAPGSVVKPIVAGIGLTEGAISPNEGMIIQGAQWQRDKSWGNYKITRVNVINTPVDLQKALLYSDNIYFARTALQLGKEDLSEGLKNFGFEEQMEFAYPMESSKIGALDNDIHIADTGYGQGQMEMNILHLTATYTPIVNNGNMIKPVLLQDDDKNQVWKENVISPEHATILSNDLIQVVENPQGTAYAAKISGVKLAGKTGTAELKAKQGEKGTENGWFVAYNAQDKDLLLSMMIEGVENKGGSKYVVQKVKKIFQ